MYKAILCAAFAASLGTAHAAIKEQPVTYKDGETTLEGYLVYDDAISGKRPGVIVIHEWWGITPHVRDEGRRLARQGYTAFLADMYGGGKTADNPKDAGAMMNSVMQNPAVMSSRFDAAEKALTANPTVDASRIGAVGFCFGGSVVLDMARAGHNLRAVSAFHTGLVPTAAPASAGETKAKVLVQNGADDPFVKPDEVAKFKSEMDAAKVDYHYISYPGAVHAFTNPEATALGKKFNLPLAYNEKVDHAARTESEKFLKQALRQ